MTLPEICIKRPVFATVLSLVILLLGLISYQRLPCASTRASTSRWSASTRTYRGASAEVVESQVTKILEDSLAGIEGVEVMTSQSRSETSRINVRFTLKRDPDSAAADVRDKVARVRAKLPDTIDEPVIAKVEADSQPDHLHRRRGGLADADRGLRLRATATSSRGCRCCRARPTCASSASARCRCASTSTARASPATSSRRRTSRTRSAPERRNPRRPHRVDDARVHRRRRDRPADARAVQRHHRRQRRRLSGAHPRHRQRPQIGAVDERMISRFNGKPSLNIGVIKQAVANPLDLSKAVRAEVDKINESLPPGMKLIVAYDTSVFIDRSIHSVFETIGEAILLVVLVIFFFLRSLRATVIPIVTIPVSLIGAFALMYFLGFTINTLTLLAMVLAIGLVVDDAIVMLENIFRHIEEGMPRKAGGDHGRPGDRLRDRGDDADADVGVRAARLRHRPHRPAVHRVRADARRRGAGVGLRRADAVADDVLAAAAPPGAAFAGSTT